MRLIMSVVRLGSVSRRQKELKLRILRAIGLMRSTMFAVKPGDVLKKQKELKHRKVTGQTQLITQLVKESIATELSSNTMGRTTLSQIFTTLTQLTLLLSLTTGCSTRKRRRATRSLTSMRWSSNRCSKTKLKRTI